MSTLRRDITAARRRLLLVAATLTCSTCQVSLPEVPAAKLACTGDHPLGGGELPCPEADWCSNMRCTPRLGCQLPGSRRLGCDPEQSCEFLGMSCMRCEMRINPETAAVRCEPGVHTTTSTTPRTLAGCECPDGTFCTLFDRGGAEGAYPLFILPPGTPRPMGSGQRGPLSSAGEIPERRVCARGCSSELDCPASHTCRPAAVIGDDLLRNPTSTRHTIGVCYPNRLVSTSTRAPIRQPDADSCLDAQDCESNPRAAGPCQYRVTEIADHPTVPAREAWGRRLALIQRCVPPESSLLGNDIVCTRGEQCKSGLCVSGRCAIPCNPLRAGTCPSTRGCGDVLVKRELPAGTDTVDDRAQICGPR